MTDLEQKLAEAEAAYHALLLGQSVAELRDGPSGELVRYTPANRSALMAYILTLKQQLGLNSISGPARPYFQ